MGVSARSSGPLIADDGTFHLKDKNRPKGHPLTRFRSNTLIRALENRPEIRIVIDRNSPRQSRAKAGNGKSSCGCCMVFMIFGSWTFAIAMAYLTYTHVKTQQSSVTCCHHDTDSDSVELPPKAAQDSSDSKMESSGAPQPDSDIPKPQQTVVAKESSPSDVSVPEIPRFVSRPTRFQMPPIKLPELKEVSEDSTPMEAQKPNGFMDTNAASKTSAGDW